MNQIMKTVKSLKEAGLLINCVAQTIKNEVKEQKRVFPGMILGTLGASFLGNLLTGKKAIATCQERNWKRCNQTGEDAIRAGQDF